MFLLCCASESGFVQQKKQKTKNIKTKLSIGFNGLSGRTTTIRIITFGKGKTRFNRKKENKIIKYCVKH